MEQLCTFFWFSVLKWLGLLCSKLTYCAKHRPTTEIGGSTISCSKVKKRCTARFLVNSKHFGVQA